PTAFGPPAGAGGAAATQPEGKGAARGQDRRARQRGDGEKKSDLGFKIAQKQLQGVVFDCAPIDANSHEATKMSEMGAEFSEAFSAAGRGRSSGPPPSWVFGGPLTGLMERKEAVGATNAKKLTEIRATTEQMDVATKADNIKFCKMDWCYDQNKKKLLLHLDPTFRSVILDCLTRTVAEMQQGRAPPTHMERELQEWLEAFTDMLVLLVIGEI
ncbi:unnamed protein product, partial [Prorocentrum cordatum]